MYYNPYTQEILDRNNLKNKINTSFPEGTENVGDWFLMHDDYPHLEENQIATKSDIVLRDGIYVQTYTISQKPNVINNINNLEVSEDLESRVKLLEKGIMDIAQWVSNLEDYRIYFENKLENREEENNG